MFVQTLSSVHPFNEQQAGVTARLALFETEVPETTHCDRLSKGQKEYRPFDSKRKNPECDKVALSKQTKVAEQQLCRNPQNRDVLLQLTIPPLLQKNVQLDCGRNQ